MQRARATWVVVGALVGAALMLGILVYVRETSPFVQPAADFLSDPQNDCGSCSKAQDAWGVRIAQSGERVELRLRLVAEPADGDVVTIWRKDKPAMPLRLVYQGSGAWGLETVAASDVTSEDVRASGGRDVEITLEGNSISSLAITTLGGDRLPAVGYASLREDGAIVVDRLPEGGPAQRSVRRIAQAQAQMEWLDAGERRLATDLLARQQIPGTYTYEGRDADMPGVAIRMVLTLDPYNHRSRQDEFLRTDGKWVLNSSYLLLADREQYCERSDGNFACNTDRTDEEPATQVLAMQHGASLVELRMARTQEILDEPAMCLEIVESVPSGPAPGVRCAHANGVLAYLKVDGQRREIRLLEQSPEVDESAFVEREE